MRRSAAVRPIRCFQDLDRAMDRMLVLFGHQPDTPAGHELGALLDEIELYESKHPRLAPLPSVRVLRDRMWAHGLAAHEVPEVGSRSVIVAFLAGKRILLERHLLALSRRFRVPPGIFSWNAQARWS